MKEEKKKKNEKKIKSIDLIKIDEDKAKTHKLIKIKGINIYFPYEPYQAQINYMEKVISTLNNGWNKENISALESPTGTGKTLCLLCAVLAWVKENKNLISIYYCTRTVSQIKNIFKEINKTCYKLNVSFIASKKFICAKYKDSERKRMGSNELNDICKKMRKNKIKMKKKKGLLFSEQIQEEEEEDEDEIEDENINEIGDRMENEIIEKGGKDFDQQGNKDGEEKEEMDNDEEEEIENDEEDENEDEKENKNLEICNIIMMKLNIITTITII